MADQVKVPDGTDSTHPYQCLGKDGLVVETVEAIKYRVTDKNNTVLLDWTAINPALPEGDIEISGEINRVRDRNWDDKRYISVVATHDGGKKKTGWIVYPLVDNPGIVTAEDLAE